MVSRVGEWMFSGSVTSPAASGQLRLNTVSQTAATVIWIHKTTATSVDASNYLTAVTAGQEIYFQDKDNFTKWQVYKITAPPVISQTNVEYPVIWVRGGGIDVPAQRIFLAFDEVSTAEVLASPFAYPSTSAFGISLGLTKRQFYAAAAVTGLLDNAVSLSNLNNRVEWAFRIADSMIRYELSEVTDPALPAGAPRLVQSARNERLKKLQKSQRTP